MFECADEATKEINQQYVITTFDLDMCMKAYPPTWNYETHIILIGTFYLACTYFKMIEKKMEGSGLSDIFLEASLIGSGLLHGVHYDRAMHCHKVVLLKPV